MQSIDGSPSWASSRGHLVSLYSNKHAVSSVYEDDLTTSADESVGECLTYHCFHCLVLSCAAYNSFEIYAAQAKQVTIVDRRSPLRFVPIFSNVAAVDSGVSRAVRTIDSGCQSAMCRFFRLRVFDALYDSITFIVVLPKQQQNGRHE